MIRLRMLPAEDGDIASYSFVKFLMAQPKQHQKLIDDLRTLSLAESGALQLRLELTDLDFDAVQTIGLNAGLVDNKSGSVTEDFQGLQFVYRLKDRPH